MPIGQDLAALVEAVARHRDREAFRVLFGHFAPKLKAYMLRSGSSPAVAEEFAQDTMLAVWRKAGLFDRQRAAASTWVFTIARNVRIDAIRRHGHELAEHDVSQIPEAPALPDELLSEREDTVRIREALERLSDDQVKVVMLSFFHDMAHADIARALGLPLGTVKSRIRLAMGRLRDILGDAR